MDRFISASEWGANPSKDATEDSHPIGSTRGVSLHWEGPHMGPFPHSECAGKVRGIERFHEYGRGWGDVAYNLLVCPHGYVFEGRGKGVTSAANGNSYSNGTHYAVCYLGGQGDGFTDAAKDGMTWAVAYLRREGNAGPEVNGHRDHKATECPGGAIYQWLQTQDWTNPIDLEDDMAQYDKLLEGMDNKLDGLVRALGPDGVTRTKLVRVNTRLQRVNGRLANANDLLRAVRGGEGKQSKQLAEVAELLEAALADSAAGDETEEGK